MASPSSHRGNGAANPNIMFVAAVNSQCLRIGIKADALYVYSLSSLLLSSLMLKVSSYCGLKSSYLKLLRISEAMLDNIILLLTITIATA